jgi:hypothetical protein
MIIPVRVSWIKKLDIDQKEEDPELAHKEK